MNVKIEKKVERESELREGEKEKLFQETIKFFLRYNIVVVVDVARLIQDENNFTI